MQSTRLESDHSRAHPQSAESFLRRITRGFIRSDAAAIAALVAALLIVFWRVVFTPAMFFYRDVFNYSYPHARFIHEVCRHGHLPYWSPYLNYGEPVLADPNFLFFYPYTLFLILLPIDFAYTMHYIVHFGLAAAGAYWLARGWSQSRMAALFAAFVFVFSGPLLSLGSFYNHAAAAAWIPWALLMTHRAIERGTLRAWLRLALVLALQFLAAEPFTLLATSGLSLAYALNRAGDVRHPLAARNRRILAGLFLAGLLAVALSAVQFFPALDLLHHSRRGTAGLPFKETIRWSFHPLSLLEVVLPDFFGSSLTAPSLWTLVLSTRNMPYFPSVFVGFIPLFFALAGWALGRDRRRHFAAAAALVLLLLSFGGFTPLFALVYLVVPPLHLVRFPVKLLVPAVLMIAMLAGWGVDAFRQLPAGSPRGRARTRILRPLCCLLAGALLIWVVSLAAPRWITAPAAWVLLRTNAMFLRGPAGQLSASQVGEAAQYLLASAKLRLPELAAFALGGLLWLFTLEREKARSRARQALPLIAVAGIAQLVVVNYSANPTVPKSFYSYRPPVLDHFRNSAQPFRFCYILREAARPPLSADAEDFLNFDSIPEAAGLSPLAQAAFRDRILIERGSMLTEVETSLNNDVDRSFPPFLYEFWFFALRQLPDQTRTDCLLGRTNVKYLIRPRREANASVREVAPVFNGSAQPSYLYEDLCALPRSYIADRATDSGSALETLARVSAPDFDARHEIVLGDDSRPSPSTPPGLGAIDVDRRSGSATLGSAHAVPPSNEVQIIDRQPDTVTLDASLSQPGYVVLLDRFDPNWHATLDGHEATVLRANLLFRAVRAGAGRHRVHFYYRQRGLGRGAVVSALALGLAVALWLLDNRLLADARDAPYPAIDDKVTEV